MRVTFISSYLNHHQLPFCEEMVKNLGDNFKYVATDRISKERLKLGYEDMNSKYDFVIRSYENDEEVYRLCNESDVVIIGSAPKKYVANRIKRKNGITYTYSERLFKRKDFKSYFRKIYYIFIKERIQNDQYFLLCASAFASKDYGSMGLFKNRAFKWGYFPKINYYENIDALINKKESNSIVWVGRFIEAKHPEHVVFLAKRMKENHIDFHIKMVGTGVLFEYISDLIKSFHLEDNIQLLGSMPTDKVRTTMEKSKLFLFTSDKWEGWGAVLNEAMNSGCAVIANSQIGSVPFLVEDGFNGNIYSSLDDLYCITVKLLKDAKLTKKMGKNAYTTMLNVWSPKVAAERIIEVSKKLLEHTNPFIYENGPCSIAEPLDDNWYKSELG